MTFDIAFLHNLDRTVKAYTTVTAWLKQSVWLIDQAHHAFLKRGILQTFPINQVTDSRSNVFIQQNRPAHYITVNYRRSHYLLCYPNLRYDSLEATCLDFPVYSSSVDYTPSIPFFDPNLMSRAGFLVDCCSCWVFWRFSVLRSSGILTAWQARSCLPRIMNSHQFPCLLDHPTISCQYTGRCRSAGLDGPMAWRRLCDYWFSSKG